DPRRPGKAVVAIAARDGGVAGERDGEALKGVSPRAGADQFVALLAPHPAAAGEHPRRPGGTVVRPAHDGEVAVAGQRDRPALLGGTPSAGADQLASLLAPQPAAAGEDPRRAGSAVVIPPAHDGGVAVRATGDLADQRRYGDRRWLSRQRDIGLGGRADR